MKARPASLVEAVAMLGWIGGHQGRASTSLAPASQALPRSIGPGSTAESVRHRTSCPPPRHRGDGYGSARAIVDTGHMQWHSVDSYHDAKTATGYPLLVSAGSGAALPPVRLDRQVSSEKPA